MPKPPETPPHSDIEGVNRDARAGTPSKSPHPDPGAAIEHARHESKARPEQTHPSVRCGRASEGACRQAPFHGNF